MSSEFIASGGYDRQSRRTRLAYRGRRDRLAAALRRQERHVTGIAAGLHAVLDLPGAEAERQLITRAARHGLALQGLDSFRAAGVSADRAGLVIGDGPPPDPAHTTALDRLCAGLDPGVARPGCPPGAPGRPAR